MTRLYYERGPVKLFHGDCLELVPTLDAEGVDAVVTDPPYGIAINIRHGANWRNSERPQCVIGDEAEFDPTPFLGWKSCLLWGANNFASRLPESGRWLVWDKRDGTGSNAQADCEFAWARNTNGSAARLFRLMWNGNVRAEERGEPRIHPTQKPVSVMTWCLDFYPTAKVILDPFSGSGTTAIACIRTGRSLIGCEIDESHCENAARRIDRELDQGKLFEPTPPQPVQKSLLG